MFQPAGRCRGPGHQLLMTDLGMLDVLGVVEGGRGYGDLLLAAATVLGG